MHRTFLTAVVVVALAASAWAEQVEFPQKKAPGTYLTVSKMKSTQDVTGPQTMKATMDVTTTMETTIEKATSDGQKAAFVIKRIQMKGSVAGQDMSFDSAQDNAGANPMAKGMAQLLDKQMEVTLDAKGAISKVEGGANAEKMAKEMFTGNFPDKPVDVGGKWEKTTTQDMPGGAMTVKTSCTLRKVETVGGHKVAVVDVVGKGSREAAKPKPGEDAPAAGGKADVAIKGWSKIDLTTGQTVEADMTVDADIDMGPMSIKSKSAVTSTTQEGKYVAPKKTEKSDDQPEPVQE